MIDVILAIANFAVLLALGLFGPNLIKNEQKVYFYVLVIIGAVVTGVAVKRGADASSRVEADLKGIRAELRDLHAEAPNHQEVATKGSPQTATATITINVKPSAEDLRRYKVLNALRIEYILSHRDLPSQILAGIDWPPLEWINRRLAELGEPWTVLPGNNPSEIRFHNLSP